MVPAGRAVWCWFRCMESGNAGGTRWFGNGDELCLMSVEACSSWIEALTERGLPGEATWYSGRFLGMLSKMHHIQRHLPPVSRISQTAWCSLSHGTAADLSVPATVPSL